jgi:hypothetical protein
MSWLLVGGTAAARRHDHRIGTIPTAVVTGSDQEQADGDAAVATHERT